MAGAVVYDQQGNLLQNWDLGAGTYTQFDVSGAVVTTRPLTQAEITQYTPDVTGPNRDALQARAQQALATNRAALQLPDPTANNQAFNQLASPTNPQVLAQVKALTTQNNALISQVQALTAQNSALIRLALGSFDATN